MKVKILLTGVIFSLLAGCGYNDNGDLLSPTSLDQSSPTGVVSDASGQDTGSVVTPVLDDTADVGQSSESTDAVNQNDSSTPVMAVVDNMNGDSETVAADEPVSLPTVDTSSQPVEDTLDTSVTTTPTSTNPPVIPRNNENSPLGTNIGGIRDWITSQPFVDVFKSARAFKRHSSGSVVYDANGWPKDLKGGNARTYVLTNLPAGSIPFGRYTVLYDGKGTIKYSGKNVKVAERKPGRDIVEITGSLAIEITETDPADYIRNIRVLMPGGICESDPLQHAANAAACPKGDYLDFVTHHNDIVFNPDFLRYLQSFKVLRFMDLMATNNSEIRNWSDMPKRSTATWGGTGDKKNSAPVEIMVDLANRLNADPWFCMPHLATDDYVTKFANYVRDNLKPGLKVYIEYSNEVWNNMFKQTAYAIEQGQAMNLDSDRYTAGMKYFSRRSVEIFKIWNQTFQNDDRVVTVMGAHASNPWRSDAVVLPYEDAYKHTDALAIAPYFGGDPEPLRSLNTVGEIFTKLKDPGYKQSLQSRIEAIKEFAAVAQKYNVDLIAYEGGQHLVDWTTSSDDQHPNPLFYAANRDPRMGALYKEYMQAWKDAGGKLFVHFTSPEEWGKFGSWGVKEHLNQPASETPKYNAVVEFINNNPRW